MTLVGVLIALACAMFFVSFFTGLAVMEKSVSSTDIFSDKFTLEPLANKTSQHTIEKESLLTIYASANSTFETTLLLAGELAATPTETASVRNTYKLFDVGDYTVKFHNTNPTNIEITYRIIIVEKEYKTIWALLWLRWPIFALGILFMLLTIPAYFSPWIGRYVKGKHVKAAILIMCVVLILFSYQITGLFLKTSTPWVIAQGISMEPNMHPGDFVVVEGTQAQELQVNDIILYNKFAINTTTGLSRTLPTAVLHRIVDQLYVNGRWYFATKGDNNPNPDESLVPEDGVLGKAVYVIPRIGYVIAFLTRTETKVILLAIIAVAYFAVPELKSELKKRKVKNKPTVEN